MKKFLSFIIGALLTVSASATPTNVTGYSSLIYPASVSYGQIGGEAVVKIMAKHTSDFANMQFQALSGLPEGVTLKSAKSSLPGYGVATGTTFVVSTTSETNYFAPGEYCICEITFDVASTVAAGEYEITIGTSKIASPDDSKSVKTDEPITSVLKIQRSAVVVPMDEGYGLEILPFAAVKPGNFGKIPVYVKAGANLLNIEFDIETPKGLMLLNDAYASSFVLNSSACKNLPTVTISNESALYNGYHVAIKGAKVPPTAQKYVNATSEYFKLGDIDYCVDNTWGDDYLLADGIHKLSIKNIMMQELVSGDIHSGNNITSVFVGNTSADKNPILYGHYTDAVTNNLANNEDLKEMVKDLVSVDFTSTNVEITSLNSMLSFFDGKLISNAATGSGLARLAKSGVKWGTVCVPFEFVNNIGNVKFYTLSSVGENYISLKGFSAGETIPANTPLFYNITSGSKMSLSSSQYIDMSSCTPSVAGASADGLTMKGTYETFDLASGAGYYISNNKLYSDGAKIRPFRAYIEGAASVKSLSIFLEDETGLVDITDKFSEEDIYNLQGMKLNKTQKGVNIVGGKKVLVK